MSESVEAHGVGEPGDAGMGAASGTGQPTEGRGTDSQASDPSKSTGRESGDYKQRLQEDHEFAIAQAQEWQRKFSQKDSRYSKIKELEQYAEQAGGTDTLKAQIDMLYRMANDPVGGKLINEFATSGTFRNAQTEAPDDEWIDPEQKEIAELKAQIAELRTTTTSTSREMAKDRLTNLFTDEFKRWPGMTDEHRETIQQVVDRDIQNFGKTPEGIRSLGNMGEESVRAMMLRALPADQLEELMVRSRAMRDEARGERATHDSPRVATGGGGEVVEDALSAFRSACRQEGLNPDDPFR